MVFDSKGTAYKARGKHIEIAGKTGTAQVFQGGRRGGDEPPLPPHKGVTDLLSPESREMELLAKLDGRIKFELKGRRRRRWSVDAAFGPAGMRAGRPRTTVTIDAGTCEKLATRALNCSHAGGAAKRSRTCGTSPARVRWPVPRPGDAMWGRGSRTKNPPLKRLGTRRATQAWLVRPTGHSGNLS